MKNGYFELGEAKGVLYMGISLVFALLVVAVNRKELLTWRLGSGLTSYAAMAFLFSNVISFICSRNKAESFLGLPGWREGFLTLFLMLFICAAFSREKVFNKYIVAAILITPAFEFALGILGRFRIYPIEIYGQNNSFLGTIGNINWYVAYLSIFVPVGIGLCYTEKLFSKGFFLCAVYEVLGLVALFVQGSESALLTVFGVFFLLLILSFGSRCSFKKIMAQLFILGLSMEIVEVLMMCFGSVYNYQDNLLIVCCRGYHGLILMALAFFLYRLSRLFEEVKAKWRGKIYTEILLVATALLLVAGGFIIFRDYDYNFGNGRGLIWSISVDMFKGLSPWRQLVGVGQDGFYGYAYSEPEIAQSLLNVFPGNVLTNAHCELLTMLIERGLMGVMTYLFFIGTVFYEFCKNKKERAAIVCALPVIAYFLNGLVSFPTSVSTPYMFIAIGIGLSASKTEVS